MTSPTTDRRQGLVGNTPMKAPVDCATTANITLSGEQTIDGVLTSQSRVLVWHQTDTTQNGIYNSSSAAWTRADDADGNYDLVNGSMVLVTGGTTNGGYAYRVNAANPVQPGTSAINFVLGLFSSLIAAAFLASGTGAASRSGQDKMRDEISAKDFGAVGDGVSRQLSSLTTLGGVSVAGWTLAQWQVLYPHATALTNQLDWVAGQAAVNTGKTVKWPYGSFIHDQPLAVSTYNQRLEGSGRQSTITYNLAASGAGVVLSGASGRQQVFGFNHVGGVNCAKVIDYTSPQVQVMFNWITAAAAGSTGVYGENENTGAGIYDFGAQVCFNFIHGSLSVGSRGIRFGNNSQTSTVFGNVVDNFENGLGMEGACDSILVEANVFETLMSTGYGVDMRGVGGSPTYKNIVIRGNHFEDVYGAIAWGNNGIGPTYTSNLITGNFISGHGGGTTYFLSIVGLCGAGSGGNAVEFNDATNAGGATAVTAFFNFTDANGAASIVSRRGNTVAAGAWVTGSQSIYAYNITQANGYFGNVVAAGAITSSANNRLEVQNGTVRVPVRWEPGEYLESVQFKYTPIGSTPTVTATLYKASVDTVTSVATSGAVTASGVVTIPVNAVAVQGFNYYMEFVNALGGGTTAYDYPTQLYKRF